LISLGFHDAVSLKAARRSDAEIAFEAVAREWWARRSPGWAKSNATRVPGRLQANPPPHPWALATPVKGKFASIADATVVGALIRAILKLQGIAVDAGGVAASAAEHAGSRVDREAQADHRRQQVPVSRRALEAIDTFRARCCRSSSGQLKFMQNRQIV